MCNSKVRDRISHRVLRVKVNPADRVCTEQTPAGGDINQKKRERPTFEVDYYVEVPVGGVGGGQSLPNPRPGRPVTATVLLLQSCRD